MLFPQVRRDVDRQRETSVLNDRAIKTSYYKSPVGTRYRIQDRIGQDWTGQDRIGQDRTGQDRKGQDRTGQDRMGQDRTGQERIGQDRKGQKRIGQKRTGQDRIGHSDKLKYVCLGPLKVQALYSTLILLGVHLFSPLRRSINPPFPGPSSPHSHATPPLLHHSSIYLTIY